MSNRIPITAAAANCDLLWPIIVKNALLLDLDNHFYKIWFHFNMDDVEVKMNLARLKNWSISANFFLLFSISRPILQSSDTIKVIFNSFKCSKLPIFVSHIGRSTQMFNINLTWIWTAHLLCQKQPLCQLSHNHWPITYISFAFWELSCDHCARFGRRDMMTKEGNKWRKSLIGNV